MNNFAEERIRLEVIKEIAASREEEEKMLADHLVRAMYFSAEASKRLRGLVESATSTDEKQLLRDVLIEVLCNMKALLGCADAAGLRAQLAIVDAQRVIDQQLATIRPRH